MPNLDITYTNKSLTVIRGSDQITGGVEREDQFDGHTKDRRIDRRIWWLLYKWETVIISQQREEKGLEGKRKHTSFEKVLTSYS